MFNFNNDVDFASSVCFIFSSAAFIAYIFSFILQVTYKTISKVFSLCF